MSADSHRRIGRPLSEEEFRGSGFPRVELQALHRPLPNGHLTSRHFSRDDSCHRVNTPPRANYHINFSGKQ
jgi:hypothetical protein